MATFNFFNSLYLLPPYSTITDAFFPLPVNPTTPKSIPGQEPKRPPRPHPGRIQGQPRVASRRRAGVPHGEARREAQEAAQGQGRPRQKGRRARGTAGRPGPKGGRRRRRRRPRRREEVKCSGELRGEFHSIYKYVCSRLDNTHRSRGSCRSPFVEVAVAVSRGLHEPREWNALPIAQTLPPSGGIRYP